MDATNSSLKKTSSWYQIKQTGWEAVVEHHSHFEIQNTVGAFRNKEIYVKAPAKLFTTAESSLHLKKLQSCQNSKKQNKSETNLPRKTALRDVKPGLQNRKIRINKWG